MSAPARSLESAGGDLSQRNRLVRVMTEGTSIKKFARLAVWFGGCGFTPQIRRQPCLIWTARALVAGAAAHAVPAGFTDSRRSILF